MSLPTRESGRSVLLSLFIFAAFFPVPALISVGGGVGITAATLLSLALLAVSGLRVQNRRAAWLTVAFVATALLASLARLVAGDAGRVTVNTVIGLCIALLPLAAVATVTARELWQRAVVPLAAAVVAHALISAGQMIVFAGGTFPLPGVWNNPSFAPLDFEVYGEFIRRPLGFFPEPSAMAACLGPVILILFRLAPGLRGRRAALVWSAVALGSAALLTTASVFLLFWLPLMAVQAVLHFLQVVRSVRARLISGSVLAGVLGGLIVWAGVTGRLRTPDNDSSFQRFESLVQGLGLFVDGPWTFLFGGGPGSTPERLAERATEATTVHSLVLAQVVEFGLLNLALWLVIIWLVCRSPWRLAGVAWLLGVGLTTSYSPLACLWVVLVLIISKDSDAHLPRHSHAGHRRR